MEKKWEKFAKMFGDKHIYFNEKSQALSQMSYALRTLGHRPKVIWTSKVGIQNWDSYCPKTLAIHIFIKLSFFFLQMWGQYLIALKKIFPKMYSMPPKDLIWPLLSRDLWWRVKFLIWFLPLHSIVTHANHV